jgi:hypothetical protein
MSQLRGFNKTLNALLIINVEWATGWGAGPASVIHDYMSQFFTSLRDMVSDAKTSIEVEAFDRFAGYSSNDPDLRPNRTRSNAAPGRLCDGFAISWPISRR